MEIVITDHAYSRLKERNGWSKKSSDRMIQRVYEKGLRASQAKGYAKKYMQFRQEEHPEDEQILYGETLYVFNKNILITAFGIQQKMSGNKSKRCEMRISA